MYVCIQEYTCNHVLVVMAIYLLYYMCNSDPLMDWSHLALIYPPAALECLKTGAMARQEAHLLH